MLERWAISMAISFIMRQLSKFLESINWETVKADLAARVRDLVPGSWFDSEAVAVAMAMVDAVAAILSASSELESVLKLLADQKWQDAWQVLRDLIMKQWQPQSAAEKKVLKFVEDNAQLPIGA